MKILHVSHYFHPVVGGVEKNIEDLCRGLIELGHQSDVCCLSLPGAKRDEIYNGIKIHRIASLDMKFYKIAPSVARIIKKYDIIHVHGIGFFSDYLGLTKIKHCKPLVLSTHGGIFHTTRLSILKKPYFYLWSRLPLLFFDRLVAVSESDKKLFSRISSNITMIPDSVIYENFSKIKRKPIDGTLVYVGRLSPNKRLDNLMKAFFYIHKKQTNSKLFIIGGDWQGNRRMLESLSKKLGIEKNVVFTGRISHDKLINFFEKAQFFVCASEYEGFGISILEAMAAGLPVVVNDIDAFRTFVKNRENGFITNFSKPRKAAELILSLSTNKSKLAQISRQAKTSAKAYDYKRIAKDIEDVYKYVLR
jgi:alpha-1,3-mannosyltransferase